jgi:hypothetical protein
VLRLSIYKYSDLPFVAREWNTPTREPWNGVIKTALDAVDRHNAFYFQTKDHKHLIAAELLRSYVKFLKDLLVESEKV